VNELTEAETLTMQLYYMEKLKDHPDREEYCIDFDNAFRERKQRYKDTTGKEWEGN
jgi:hypothetical protein